MRQSNSLEAFLAGLDGLERRPTSCTAIPADPDSGQPRPPLSLVRYRPEDSAVTDRRRVPRRAGPKVAQSQSSASLAGTAGAILDQLDLAVVLLDPEGYVRLANAAMRRIAARGDCLRIRGRKLQLIDRQAQASLEEFLNVGITADGLAGSRCLSRRSNGPVRYAIMAQWLGPTAPDVKASALLLIYEPFRATGVDTELLAQLYGLTEMESRLAAALYRMPRLDDAADDCGVGLNTAKTHLKRVFIKCCVGSKAELLRLLALGPR